MANNLTPTRPTIPRPSYGSNEKQKLQQRLTLNHVNPALSTSSIISTTSHGSSHHKSKGFGIDISVTEDNNADNDTTILQFPLKLEKYTSTLTVPGLNIFNRSTINNNKSINQTKGINEKTRISNNNHVDDIDPDEIEFKSHLDVEEKVKTLYGIDEIAQSLVVGEIEFCYIQQSEDDPYKFRIIGKPDSMYSKPYCTVSKNGIVRYSSKECEYEELNEFMSDLTVFNKLKKMKIFKEYLLWKSMLVWKLGVKQRKYMKYKESLTKSYFMLEDRFQKRMPYITDRCAELSNIKMLNLDINSVLDINEFVKIQEEIVQKAMKVKNKILTALIEYLQSEIDYDSTKIIEKVTEALNKKGDQTYSKTNSKRIKKDKDIKLKSTNTSVDFFEPTSSTVQPSISIFDSQTFDQSTVLDSFQSKSLYAKSNSNYENHSTAEIGLSYTDRANIRASCRKLANFLRITDFLIRNALFDAVRSNLQTLFNFMSAHRSDRGLFSIKLMMVHENDNTSYKSNNSDSSNTVVFDIQPNTDYFMQIFHSFLANSIVFGCHVKSLITEYFRDSLAPIANEIEELSLLDIVSDRNNIINSHSNDCMSLLGQDFNELMAKISKFQYLCNRYMDHYKYISKTTPSSMENMTVEEINELLAATEEEVLVYTNMQSLYDIGLIRLDLSEVKKSILLKTNEKLTLLHNIIPIIHNKIEDTFSAEIFHLSATLEKIPESLDEFIKLLEVFNETNKESDRLYAEFSKLTGFYDIFTEFKLPNNDTIMSKYISLSNLWYKFNDAVLEFENSLDLRFKTYRLELKARVYIMMKPVDEGKLFLNNSTILSPDSDPNLILPELQRLYDLMQAIRDESNVVERYQILMQTSVFSVALIRDVIDAISSNFKLWTSVSVMRNISNTLKSGFFKEIEIEMIKNQMNVVSNSLATVNENFNYTVRMWVSDSLNSLMTTIPIVEMLQTKTLQQRHIDQLTESFGRDIFDSNNNRGDTVEKLISEDIFTYSSLIESISTQSQYEYNIELKINEITLLCNTKEFTFDVDPASNISCISNFVELKEFLEDKLYWVESCIQSKHSKPHMLNLSSLYSVLKTCIPSLEYVQILQLGYIQLRVIFTNARTARQLSHAMRHFQVVDDVWRIVTGITRSNPRIMELFNNHDIFANMKHAINAVDEINKAMDVYVEEQCTQWPKLYLMDRTSLIDAITTNDPQESFLKIKSLLPALSHLKFFLDKHGSFIAEGFVSIGNENLNFLQGCPVRSSLADWMRGLENALIERLKFETNQFIDLKANALEDLQKAMFSDQSRILSMQVFFWNLVYQGLQSTAKNRSMKPLLQVISDQLYTCSGINNSTSTHYQIKSVANIITLLMYQRDFTEKLLDDPDSENSATSFLIENAIKKKWNATSPTIIVHQGRMQVPYGFNYCGFGERLVLTPLTDRCMHVMSTAFHNLNVPFVAGKHGQCKRNMVTALAQELGSEGINCECSLVQNPETLFKYIRVSFASNLFLAFCDSDLLSLRLQSILFTQILNVFSGIARGSKQLNINGQLTTIMPSGTGQIPRLSVIYNTSQKSPHPFLPASVRGIFRPIQLIPPTYQAIFKIVLTAYSFWDISKSAVRLAALCDHISVKNNIEYRVIGNLAITSIKSVGIMMLTKTVVVTNKQQVLRVTQELIKNIPHHLQKNFTDEDLRYISNVFLEYDFNPDIDRLKFRPQKQYPSDVLVEFFMNTSLDKVTASSIIVVGDVGIGKSSLINSSIDKATLISTNPLNRYKDNGINPFLMSEHPEMSIAGNYAMHHAIDQVEPFASTVLMHLDLHSSEVLPCILSSSESYAKSSHKSIKFIWEITDVSHIDPSILACTQILHMKGRSFTLNDLIRRNIHSLCQKYESTLEYTLQKCVDSFLIPSLHSSPDDSFLNSFTLAENALRMFEDIFNASNIINRINENYSIAVTKIFIFSCIWTIGASSPTSQHQFDKWFKSHLKKVFPVVQRGGSLPIPMSFFQDGPTSFIHHYYLQTVEGDDIIDWIPCSQLQFIIDSSTISDNDLSKRLIMTSLPTHSYSEFYHSNTQESIVVSTHTGDAVRYLQQCILKNKGSSSSLMLLGRQGSGKSSIVKQLCYDFCVEAGGNKRSNKFRRWVCFLRDSQHPDIHGSIKSARKNISEYIVEDCWPDEGVLIIEDVNIRNDIDFVKSSVEWLRSLCERRLSFDHDSLKWRNRSDIYSVTTANPFKLTVPNINQRLMRHNFCVSLDEINIKDVFSVKLCSKFPSLFEITDDIINISFNLLCSIKDACKDILIDLKVTATEKIFASVISGQSIPSLIESVLGIMSNILVTLSGFTNYDALRVWDRVISDYFTFVPSIESSLSKSLVKLYHSSQRYKFQGFSERIKRELDMKEEACQKLETGRSHIEDYDEEDLQELKLLDKYISGFAKNGPTYNIGLVSPEYVREIYIQKSLEAIPSIISAQSVVKESSLGYFMDVQRLICQLLDYNLNPHSLFIGHDFTNIEQILRTVSRFESATSYHCVKIVSKSSIRHLIEEEVKHVKDFLENCNFFMRNRANKLSLSGSKSPQNGSIIVTPLEDDSIITSEVFFSRYPTSTRVWHIHICLQEDSLDDDIWIQLVDIIELSDKILINKLLELGLPDIRKYVSSRTLISHYLKKQRYYFTFCNSSRTVLSTTNRFILNPTLTKRFRIFNSSSRYVYLRSFYKTTFASKYSVIDGLIDEFAKIISRAIVSQNLHHQDHHHDHIHQDHAHDDHHRINDGNEIVKLINSKDFKMGSLEAIEYLYKTSITYSDTHTSSWTSAMMIVMKAISVGARHRHYFALKKKTNSGSPIITDSKILADYDTLNDDNDSHDTLLFDAVFNVIFSRYVMILNEERQNGVTQQLIKKFKTLNLPRSVNFDILPLATAIVICQDKQIPPFLPTLEKVVSVAKSLPEPSSLRRILSGLSIMLICNCKESSIVGRLIDRTSVFRILFSKVFNLSCIMDSSSVLNHGSSRVLNITLSCGEESDMVPMPLTESNTWMFTINPNSKCMIELFIIYMISEGYCVSNALSVPFEKHKICTTSVDDSNTESDIDIAKEKTQFDEFKSVSSDLDLQWSLTWKDMEKIVHSINAVILAITISIEKRKLPSEYEDKYFSTLKTFIDRVLDQSYDNFKLALVNALNNSIQLIRNLMTESDGFFFDTIIFWKLSLGWGDHHYQETKKLLSGLSRLNEFSSYLELGIKSNIVEDLEDSNEEKEYNGQSLYMTKDSQEIFALLDTFNTSTHSSKRHSIIGTTNANISNNNNNNSFQCITSIERLSELSIWIADFPHTELKFSLSLSSMERFIIGYILKPLSLPLLLSEAISELGSIHKSTLEDDSPNKVVIYNPAGCIDIKSILRSVANFDIQCYMGGTYDDGTVGYLLTDVDGTLLNSSRTNETINSEGTSVLECMGHSVDSSTLNGYVNSKADGKSIVEIGQLIGLDIDTKSVTTLRFPTFSTDSFLSNLHHALEIVQSIPALIYNSNPKEKKITSVARKGSNNENDEEKENKALMLMTSKAVRIRWLLAVYHSMFLCRFLTSSEILIGDDTLVIAVKEIDHYFSSILSASLAISSSSTTSSSLLSGIKDEICVEFIINTFYFSLLHSAAQQSIAGCLFRLLFSPKSLDIAVKSSSYLLQGNIKIPESIDEGSILSFMKTFKTTLSEKIHLNQLLGLSSSEVTTLMVDNINNSMNGILATINDESSNDKFTLSNIGAVEAIPSLLLRIKQEISLFEKMLPSKIDLNSEEVTKAVDHQVTANRLSRIDGKNSKKNSRRGLQMKGGEVLEFDPLYAHVLSECTSYNSFIDNIHRQCEEIKKKESLSEEELRYLMEIVISLESGMIPHQWLASSSLTCSVTSWISIITERKSFLISWVLSGHPGLIQLHVLSNPLSLLHALKESYAIKIDSSPDKISLAYHWVTTSSAIEKIDSIHHQNLGCSIILSPMTLLNATMIESKQQLARLPSYYRDNRGPNVALIVNANLDYVLDDVYHCPLYITRLIPVHIDLFKHSKSSNDNNDNSANDTYLLIPIELQDRDIDVSGPKLLTII